MHFTKMQGAGNDFIVINNMEMQLSAEQLSDAAEALCRRRFSIGADGMMAVMPASRGGDFAMLFYNSDGSMGEMCGNGARCIARYGFDSGLAGEEMTIETTAGPVRAWRISEDRYKVRLNDVSRMELSMSLDACGRQWNCAYVELGDPGLPHLVVEYPGLAELMQGPDGRTCIGEDDDRLHELRQLGRALRSHPVLPKGANVNFYETAGGKVWEKTFERGVEDFTYACGTGTGSTAAVLSEKGLAGDSAEIIMAGGVLQVDVIRREGRITDLYLTGPAVTVCEGETV